MPWLPNPDNRPIWLDLIHVPSFDPDRLRLDRRRRLHDCRSRCHYRGRRNNSRSGDNRWRCHYDRRRGKGIIDESTDDTADESGPKTASAAPPIAVVMVSASMMMDGRTVMKARAAAVMSVRSRKRAERQGRHANRNYQFLVHFRTPFFGFAQAHPVRHYVRTPSGMFLTIFLQKPSAGYLKCNVN